MIHSTPNQDTCINPVSSDPSNHSVVRHKSLEHLDLALSPTSPNTLKPPRSDRYCKGTCTCTCKCTYVHVHVSLV